MFSFLHVLNRYKKAKKKEKKKKKVKYMEMKDTSNMKLWSQHYISLYIHRFSLQAGTK